MATMFEKIKSPLAPAQFESFLLQFKDDLHTALRNIDVLEKSVECEFKLYHDNKTIVYRYADRKWKPCKPQNQRPWHTVITQNNIKEDMLEDVTQFQEDEEFYREHGIPYRRGYLLHGPPGTGKTSLVHSLVGKLNYSICSLNLSDPNMTDDDLMRCLSDVPNKCVVLIEEVDVALPSEKRLKYFKAEKEKGVELTKSRLTLSGVLNAIDGVASEDSQILIMTTNHKDHLDPALIRPGRVDRDFYFDNCNAIQVKDIFKNFFPDATEGDLTKVLESFSKIEVPVSPAKLQGYLLRFKKSLPDAQNNLHILDDTSEDLPPTPHSGDSGCSINEAGLSEAIQEIQKENDIN
jgi:chaperone BCS1